MKSSFPKPLYLAAPLLILAAMPALAAAQSAKLPEPAIAGLRYYYPPEKVEPRVVETDICIYG